MIMGGDGDIRYTHSFMSTFGTNHFDIAMIRKTTQRKVYINLCAQYHNTTDKIALEIIEDNGLFVALPITNKLITNYNISIDFQQNMPGTAEIITDQKSLLQRVMNPLKSIIKDQKNYH